VALVGLDQFITKNATLCDEKSEDAHTIKAMKFSVRCAQHSDDAVWRLAWQGASHLLQSTPGAGTHGVLPPSILLATCMCTPTSPVWCSPVVRVAVEPKVASDLPKLVEGERCCWGAACSPVAAASCGS